MKNLKILYKNLKQKKISMVIYKGDKMKKKSVEEKISASLNSIIPSQNVTAAAREYMSKNTSTKISSKNKAFKYGIATVSSICIIIVCIILLPILINGANTEDPRLIETKEIYEKEFSSIKDYNEQSLLSINLPSKECKQFILKETNEVLYIMESFIAPNDINASQIEEIIIMKEYNDKIIQSIEDYMYLDNSYVLNDWSIKYEEISSGSYCFSFEYEKYIYCIIIYDTDIITAKTLVEEILNF